MTQNIHDARDDLETAILLALHADNRRGVKRVSKDKGRARGLVKRTSDLGAFCPDRPEFPRHMFYMEVGSGNRIYSGSLDNIVVDPEAAIGTGLEIVALDLDGTLKWSKFKPMPAPRGLVAITNQPVRWFALHHRQIKEHAPDTYTRQPLAIADGRPVALKPLGWNFDQASNLIEMSEHLALSLSVYEDAIRAGSMLATVQEDTSLSFPICQEGYMDFLRMRDGYRNTPTKQRNPILHWCREHLRSRNGKTFVVRQHDRGAEEFVVGPMRLSIERSTGYSHLIRHDPN